MKDYFIESPVFCIVLSCFDIHLVQLYLKKKKHYILSYSLGLGYYYWRYLFLSKENITFKHLHIQ